MSVSNSLSIGQVAERSGLKLTALRFYEERGLIASVRTAGNQRRYRRDVLRRLAVIRAAQSVGFSLDEITAMFDGLPDTEAPNDREWRALSQSWRPLIDERITTLERLRDQLDGCIGCGCLSLHRCKLANPGDRASRLRTGAAFWSTTT